jgi:hypothetical protein
VWTIHHAVIDGRSSQLVLEEVFETYQALRDGRPVPERAAPRPFGMAEDVDEGGVVSREGLYQRFRDRPKTARPRS